MGSVKKSVVGVGVVVEVRPVVVSRSVNRRITPRSNAASAKTAASVARVGEAGATAHETGGLVPRVTVAHPSD